MLVFTESRVTFETYFLVDPVNDCRSTLRDQHNVSGGVLSVPNLLKLRIHDLTVGFARCVTFRG